MSRAILVKPDEDSITRFEPYYMVPKDEFEDMQSKLDEVKDIVYDVQELNMGNYSEDQVHDMNNAFIQLFQILNE